MEEERKESFITDPSRIEAESFAIIDRELKERGITLPEAYAPVIKRCIHTTADFDYAENLVFTEGALEAGLSALKAGADIVTDTRMAMAGISRRVLERYGGRLRCSMADEDVAEAARREGITRAAAGVDKAAREGGNFIYAVGNAPTALLRLHELISEGRIRPALIIAVPVGFVNVTAAKELILQDPVPVIAARGRKGGSTVAACICNALLYQL